MVKLTVDYFTAAKNEGHNEDRLRFDMHNIVLVDGATSVTGDRYDGRTGGEVAADIISQAAFTSPRNGVRLVRELNHALHDFYKTNSLLGQMQDPLRRCSASFACVRTIDDALVITRVGDVGVRVSRPGCAEDLLYRTEKAIDAVHAKLRAEHFAQHGDLAAARAHIVPLIKEARQYSNRENHPYGFGVIDGSITPKKFVSRVKLPVQEGMTIEVFSDGYPLVPSGETVGAWEAAYAVVEREDPNRVRRYLSTKEKDDRTVAVARVLG